MISTSNQISILSKFLQLIVFLEKRDRTLAVSALVQWEIYWLKEQNIGMGILGTGTLPCLSASF